MTITGDSIVLPPPPPCVAVGAGLRHLSVFRRLPRRHIATYTQVVAAAAMASRKLLLGLTAGRRLRHRTQQLFWAANLPEATTSRSLVAAAAAAAQQQSGRSPAALLSASRTISTTRPAAQSAVDAPGPSPVDKFVSQPSFLARCSIRAFG